MDYKETLNLPQTEFPMRANLPKREPDILKYWDEINLYELVQKTRKGKEKFILHDGPPYANGDIHMGTAMNKVIKDIVVKYKTMKGYDSPYVPGWDTHGLPIEHQIIKTKKIKRHEVGDLEFRHQCKNYALKFVDIQREQFMRLGVRGDWFNPYLTLAPSFEARQIEVFGEMYKRGYIYKGLKPVYWCTSCETALAEAEVEYDDSKSPSIFVKFPIIQDKGLFGGEPNHYVVIWTTTPWTLPANVAVALHPDFDYVRIKLDEEYYIMAEGLAARVMMVLDRTDWEVVGRYKGTDLSGLKYQHALLDKEGVVVTGDLVTLEQGSGCVHIAPGHGMEDYQLSLVHDLPIVAPLDNKGIFTEEAKQFQGLSYSEGNKAVTTELKEKNLLFHLDFLSHPYPHCWRCKKPVIFRATEQWFASIDQFREKALEAVKEVNWTPSWGEERITKMVGERHDWCISRQRIWGVPIPIFYCNDCDKELINDDTIKKVRDLFAEEGSDAWFRRTAEEMLPAGLQCPHCSGSGFRKETDIMDVWFDSGSTHAAVCDAREELGWPVDLYLEGSDQYRGWFQSSLLTSVATRESAPYRSVLTHGWVVDGEGKKMSKSVGNVVAPKEIIKNYGADILRLWVSSSDFKGDVRVSPNILKQLSEVYRKIRNTARYMLGNSRDFSPSKDRVPYSEMWEIDRWALHRLQELVETVTRAYEKYEFHQVFHSIHNFCVIDMSNFYLDVLKDRLYVFPAGDSGRRAAQTVMYEILNSLVIMIAPIMPFTAEEIWQFLPEKPEEVEKTVQLASWPEVNKNYLDNRLKEKWQGILEVRNEVSRALEEARRSKIISGSQGASVDIYPAPDVYELLKEYEEQLAMIFIVSHILLHKPDTLVALEGIYESSSIRDLKIGVSQARGGKCERCWNISETVGTQTENPELCNRCYSVIKELDVSLSTE
ncbi:isoleucine--tRNA ligase [Candidatus Contubernalis alkaliaceticus]|uniref:isoleucine--tRNA ligase n=1 Tax=Candidatus Contubernalis alkaliaceticus TaxID=338645 RepID=UPI001F4C3207|nr:isoleucine--tRNA ligase [Candidatus Contubernalis alkalaceticus]UNC92844.1 isoleucine--tRNA ligase [Candidatus Contubernalis alkalaceticus]